MPEQVHGNRALEITWTLFAFVIIAVLFVLTVRALQTDYQVEAENDDTTPDLTVHVTGYMFNWDYEYFLGDREETGVITTKYLAIPADRNVLLEITSRDVQHSFWVPDLAGKVDAIPGHTNTMWLNVSEPGRYKGQCAEYCGLNHYAMLIDVHVVEANEFFDVWLPEKMAAMSEFQPIGTNMTSDLPAGDRERGAQLFMDLACTACHQYDVDQPSGPAVQRMMDDAQRRDEYTPEIYLRESILKPCVVLAPGYEQCMMPQDYGERLDAQDLADLIEYLKEY
jgi:cytochrome c oxidase subunit 2